MFQHEVNNIYIGDARPKILYIDWTTLSAVPSWYYSAWTFTFDWWFKVTWPYNATQLGAIWIPIDLSNKKKITIESNGTRTSASRPWYDLIWISSCEWVDYSNYRRPHKTIGLMKAQGNNAAQSNSNGIIYEWTSSETFITTFTTATTTWDWNLKIEIDLTNWNVVFSWTSPVAFNQTASASSYLTEMKTYWYALVALQPANYAVSTIKNTTITLE